jgi:hypothetical protein
MKAEQTSGDDDNKVESDEFHWLSDLGMNNNHTAMRLAVTRPTGWVKAETIGAQVAVQHCRCSNKKKFQRSI